MKVLFLTHRLPYAPNRGDRIRAYHIAETLRGRVDLRIASLVHSDDEEAAAQGMRDRGLRVDTRRVASFGNYPRAVVALPGSRPLTHVLLNAAGFTTLLSEIVRSDRPDVVLAYCSGMARFALETPLQNIPHVVDLVDVDSMKWSDLGARSRPPMRWIYRREAKCLRAFECESARRAATTVVVNERERETLAAMVPGAAIVEIPNGIDLSTFSPTGEPAAAPRVVFCGVMNYAPNVAGVLWFTREVWPRIREAHHDASFSIVGADPSAAIRALASERDGIEVTGTVASVQQYLWTAAVSVAPLRVARGLQNKVLEALAAGLPTIVTSQVAEGLPASARNGCMVADTAEAFAEATVAALRMTPQDRRTWAQKAALEGLTWERQLRPMYDVLARAVQ